MHPQDLKHIISTGLLSFPVTDFDAQGNFEPMGYARRLEWLTPYGASALFAAGGTGEFFSLTPSEYPAIIQTAVQTCKNKMPIIAGVGGPTRQAIEYAQVAQAAGAQGLLVLPHYLTEAGQEGLVAHVQAVCQSVQCGVIVYNRNVCKLEASSLEQLAQRCPNLIGFKDGLGEIESMMSIRLRLGDRLAYLGGLPTAEIYAAAYKAMGVPVYSSAVFNFVPKTAVDFYHAVRDDDHATQQRLLRDFFMPLMALRNSTPGFAVSMIKAGATIVGKSAGPVRPPLTELNAAQAQTLAALIQGLGPQ